MSQEPWALSTTADALSSCSVLHPCAWCARRQIFICSLLCSRPLHRGASTKLCLHVTQAFCGRSLTRSKQVSCSRIGTGISEIGRAQDLGLTRSLSCCLL